MGKNTLGMDWWWCGGGGKGEGQGCVMGRESFGSELISG